MLWEDSLLGKSIDASIATMGNPNTAMLLIRGENRDSDALVLKTTLKENKVSFGQTMLDPDGVDLIENYIFVYYIQYDTLGQEEFEEQFLTLFKEKLKATYVRFYRGTKAVNHAEK